MDKLQQIVCAEFEAMEREAQMALLQKDGVYIGKQNREGLSCLLYQYETIYVEVRYTSHRTHIASVHCYMDTLILDDYFSSEG